MIKINVFSEDILWNKRLKNREIFFNKIANNFPNKYKFNNKKIYLTLLLSNNKNIKKLNNKFRKKNKHTDILSFPFDNFSLKKKEFYLGDIIISYNYMNKPKNLTNLEFKKKVTKIFIHGFLHLIGYDHIKNKDYKDMISEEKKIFKSVLKTLI